jgi:carboxyl-terminal processing protease
MGTAIYVWAQEDERDKREQLFRELERFATVVERIADFYVNETDSEKLINSAINGMLKELDPHSVYLDKHQYDNLMIDTKGEFGGLGITISIRNGFPTVISPIEGTPAYRLGMQGGDRIVEIEKESTNGWTSEQAVSKLRGPPGTQVNITVDREGLEDSLHYAITRDLIKVPSITYWDVIEDVGYIRVARFSERTARDLDRIISEFEGTGIEGLILDLRSNPGGLLEAAWSVAELFLEKDNLIVYTESRIPRHNKRFVSKSKRIHTGYPIVILVNGASASASEIVAGALQDWDKAVVVGQPTFGKGSVQTVFQVDGTSALKLTTAKYFTPSGRSIHRDEKKVGAVEEGATEEEVREEYSTAGGRTVYGGGGITPDWNVELPEFTDLQRQLELKSVFFSYAVHYTAYHDVDESFGVTGEVKADFMEYLKSQEIEIEEELNDEDSRYITLAIKREVFRKLFGTKGAYIATLLEDREIRKVLEMFENAPSLEAMFEYVKEQDSLAKTEKK